MEYIRAKSSKLIARDFDKQSFPRNESRGSKEDIRGSCERINNMELSFVVKVVAPLAGRLLPRPFTQQKSRGDTISSSDNPGLIVQQFDNDRLGLTIFL